MRVLIVEDEARLARNIAQVLREEVSFAVDISNDGEDGQHMALTNPYDLIILDLMLPRVNGMDILRRLRAADNPAPVLVLTARDAPADMVAGLNAGGDDYLTKPFDMSVLVARCRALVRRSHGKPSAVVEAGPLKIDTVSHLVVYEDQSILLPALEYRLLEYLAMRQGAVVSKTELIEHLYGFEAENFSNVIEVYISSLRKRFDPDHRLIRTVRGQGYILGEAPA
ncbi:MAG: Response regulator ArlR [Planctomycetes bacterium ADurb.Bin126]|nr:MAG: Response regulator ArlR [Planctomycetes bacterium ADurb.Bin126]HOD80476.1 response regulator transcription factor [Phycisphaerae bacterium]HQL72088.1 response regulator transcription factor [Phycisphaerae bacterium]